VALIDLINKIVPNQVSLSTSDGFILLGVVIDPITPDGMCSACDAAMMLGSDISSFILAALETPALCKDPVMALRSFLAYVRDPERHFPTIPNENQEQEDKPGNQTYVQ
jgi:hypothetical protein